jgi:hypothetical protein
MAKSLSILFPAFAHPEFAQTLYTSRGRCQGFLETGRASKVADYFEEGRAMGGVYAEGLEVVFS